MINIGTQIRKFRLLKNLTQEDMAEELKLTQSGYQLYENGKSKVTIDTLYKIAEIFDVSVVELLEEKPRSKSLHDCENCKLLQRVISNQSDYIEKLKRDLDECNEKLNGSKKKAS